MVMKCLVPVKRVIDYSVKIHVKSDMTGVETENMKMSMNPFDEIALEEAVKQKEAGSLTNIVAVSIGPKGTSEILRAALARGADRAIWIEHEKPLEPFNVAKILSVIVNKEAPNLILMGKQAIDDDCNQTGQMLAALLSWSQGTNCSKLILKPDQNQAEVKREVDGGLETLLLTLPAVITADLRLNEPRYLTLPNVMRAKNKPLEQITLEDLHIRIDQHVTVLKVEPPPVRRQGCLVVDAKELVHKLIHEVKIL